MFIEFLGWLLSISWIVVLVATPGIVYAVELYYSVYRRCVQACKLAEQKGLKQLLLEVRNEIVRDLVIDLGERYRSAVARYVVPKKLIPALEALAQKSPSGDLSAFQAFIELLMGLREPAKEIREAVDRGEVVIGEEEVLASVVKALQEVRFIDSVVEGLREINERGYRILGVLCITVLLSLFIASIIYGVVSSLSLSGISLWLAVILGFLLTSMGALMSDYGVKRRVLSYNAFLATKHILRLGVGVVSPEEVRRYVARASREA